MGKSLDNFGLGLSFVFLLLYWNTFSDYSEHAINADLGFTQIHSNVAVAYTFSIFLAKLIIFINLVFYERNHSVGSALRIVGWVLIVSSYFLFIGLTGGLSWEVLNQPGGGINRF